MAKALTTAEGHIRKAADLRGKGDYRGALEEIGPAIELLRSALAQLVPLDEDDDETTDLRSRTATMLADCCGIKGGLHRRLGELHLSLQWYRSGRDVEQHPLYGVVDTYCLTNTIVVGLLASPASRQEILGEILQARDVAWDQARGPRRKQWWAWADAGLLTLLAAEKDAGDVFETALDAYSEFASSSATAADYGTTIDVLKELRDALFRSESWLSGLLDRIVDELRKHARSALPRSTCFALMPYGAKQLQEGHAPFDFDHLYETVVAPAIEDSGLEPVRADIDPVGGGLVHDSMLGRLHMSEFAVADLSGANPNVFYELGVRHGSGSRATVLLWGTPDRDPPFNVYPYRHLRYRASSQGPLSDAEATSLRRELAAELRRARRLVQEPRWSDNPLVQLFLEDGHRTDLIARQKADVFRDVVNYSEEWRTKLEAARDGDDRESPLERLALLERQLNPLEDREPGVLLDLLLSYRSVRAWEQMIALIDRFPSELRRSILVREQEALALNRRARKGDRARALAILEVLNQERDSSETLSLTGRVYKDLWEESRQRHTIRALGYLRKAIDAYSRGFEADPRDAYPGINACTLLECYGQGDAQERSRSLLPVVRFAVERRLRKKSDYWDHATMVEYAVLARDDELAEEHLALALGNRPDRFATETTAANLRLILDVRRERGEETSTLLELISALVERHDDDRATPPSSPPLRPASRPEPTVRETAKLSMKSPAPASEPDDRPRAAEPPRSEWTWMVYIAADNDLDLRVQAGRPSPAERDFQQLGAVADAAGVEVVVEVDWRAQDKPSKRWHLTGSSPPECLGETNSGDGNTLLRFVEWAVRVAPARRYALVVWGHGIGWEIMRPAGVPSLGGRSQNLRDVQSKDSMPTRELAQTLKAISESALDGAPIDLLGFDACLMACVEVAYEVSPYARYFVASAADVPPDGWPYERILRGLRSQPEMPTQQLARLIVDEYVEAYRGQGSQGAITKLALDLGRIDELVGALDELAASLLDFPLGPGWLRTPTAQVQRFFKGSLCDIRGLCSQLSELPFLDRGIRDRADAVSAVLDAEDGIVLRSARIDDADASVGGLTVYFEGGGRELPAYEELRFAQRSRWHEFLRSPALAPKES